MTTVACVFVKGHVPFTSEYVRRLSAMVARWMDRPYRMVCLTDRPKEMPPTVIPIEIASPRPLKGWWSKIELFSAAHQIGGRVLYLDLDTLIVDSLAPILDFPAPFALIPDGAPQFKPSNGLEVVKRFNSSVMVWDGGTLDALYDGWSPAIARRLWGDQDYIGETMPEAAVMPAEWFPRISAIRGTSPMGTDAKVILSKHPKNVEAAARWPWVREAWA